MSFGRVVWTERETEMIDTDNYGRIGRADLILMIDELKNVERQLELKNAHLTLQNDHLYKRIREVLGRCTELVNELRAAREAIK